MFVFGDGCPNALLQADAPSNAVNCASRELSGSRRVAVFEPEISRVPHDPQLTPERDPDP